MATNKTGDPGYIDSVACSYPATPASGDPARLGYLTGVALTAEDGDGNTVVDFGPNEWDLSVEDSATGGIAIGDIIWFHDATQKLNNTSASGYFFGYAKEAVGDGLTATIKVQHVPAPGAGTIANGAVGTTQLADTGVTAAKLTATMQLGTIPLDITSLREIATNAIQNLAAHGGLLASDSAPVLERVNGATDKAIRVKWTAEADTDEAQFPPVAKPADLNEGVNLTVHIMAAMEAAADTPVIDVQVYDGLGDTEMGGNTGAITGTSITEYTVTVAHANVAAGPGFMNIVLIPAEHTTDDLYVYAAWIEYTRK